MSGLNAVIQPTLFALNNEIKAFPRSVTKTGTVTSLELIVTGVGTAFIEEVAPNKTRPDMPRTFLLYKYIYNPTTGEIREIESVLNDTTIRLKVAFNTNLAGEDFQVIDNSFLYRKIKITPQGATSTLCVIDESPIIMEQDLTIALGETDGLLMPIAINAQGTVQVEAQR